MEALQSHMENKKENCREEFIKISILETLMGSGELFVSPRYMTSRVRNCVIFEPEVIFPSDVTSILTPKSLWVQ